MKTKINVEIHQEGHNNASILAMVAHNNAGANTIEPRDIIGLIKWKKVEYPAMNRLLSYQLFTDGISIFEGEEGCFATLSLTWKEVHELVPAADENDLKEINI